MVDFSLQVSALALIVATIAVARARRLPARRVALAYLGGLAGMMIIAIVLGAPLLAVGHGTRRTASMVAGYLMVLTLAVGSAAGVVVADRKKSPLCWP